MGHLNLVLLYKDIRFKNIIDVSETSFRSILRHLMLKMKSQQKVCWLICDIDLWSDVNPRLQHICLNKGFLLCL